MGFIAGPIKHLPGTNVNDPQFGQGTCKIAYFAPLKGIAGIDSQSRSVNHAGNGEPGTQDGTMGLWQTASHVYTDAQNNLVHVVYTYTQATATSPASVSHSPNPIPTGWNDTGGVDYSNQYTQGMCNTDGLAILRAKAWGGDGSSGARLSESTDPVAPLFACTEIKYRMIHLVAGRAGGASVNFRWRNKSVVSTFDSATNRGSTSITYGGEQSEEVVLSSAVQINKDNNGNPTGGFYACSGYYTISAGDLQNGETVTIIGPSDSSYLLLYGNSGLTIRNAVLGFRANANNGGFSGYLQPQTSAGQTVPLALYASETATAAPGVTTDFSGAQSITSNPTPGNDGDGNPLPTSTRNSTFSAPVQPYRSDINGQQYGRMSIPGDVVSVKPTTIQFKNGLTLTLSQPVDLGTVAADCSLWLSRTYAALLANDPQTYSTDTTPPDPAVPPMSVPAPVVWMGGNPPGAYLAFGNGPFGNAGVYLLSRNWTSPDGSSIEQAMSVFKMTFSPALLYGLSVYVGAQADNTYNTLTLDFSWDMAIENLTTGERTTTQGSASYAFDGDPTVTVPSPLIQAQSFPVPSANTRVFVEKFSISPATIDFLEIDPVFEI